MTMSSAAAKTAELIKVSFSGEDFGAKEPCTRCDHDSPGEAEILEGHVAWCYRYCSHLLILMLKAASL